MRDIGVCLDESILCKVVTELDISPRLGQKETSYRRLIFHNQSVESLSVVKHSHLCYERDIVQFFHVMLRLWLIIRVLSLVFRRLFFIRILLFVFKLLINR